MGELLTTLDANVLNPKYKYITWAPINNQISKVFSVENDVNVLNLKYQYKAWAPINHSNIKGIFCIN
jgi:hypothetical protein